MSPSQRRRKQGGKLSLVSDTQSGWGCAKRCNTATAWPQGCCCCFCCCCVLLCFLKQGDRRRHEQWEGPANGHTNEGMDRHEELDRQYRCAGGLDKWTDKWKTLQTWTKQRTWQADKQVKDRTGVKKQMTWQVDRQVKDWTEVNKVKDLTSGQTSEGQDRCEKAKDLTSGQTSEGLDRGEQSKRLDKWTDKWRTGQRWTDKTV